MRPKHFCNSYRNCGNIKMFRLLLTAALIATATCASPKIRLREFREKNPEDNQAQIEDYPYQASLEYYGSYICGASIISETKLLTAAHCTDGILASSLNIRVNSSVVGNGGQVVKVIRICQHPEYNSWTIDNDVSVITLMSSISVGVGAQTIGLAPNGHEVAEGTLATFTGFVGNFPRNHLLALQVPRVSDQDCKNAYGASAISDSMVCFGYSEGSEDICQGNSGNPLVYDGLQVGVVSWGYGCALPNYPSVNAKVAALVDHIKSC